MKISGLSNKLQKTFLEIIQIDEVFTQEKEIITYVTTFLNKLHITYKQDKFGNIIAYIPGGGEPLLLNTHLDVPENNPHVEYKIAGSKIISTGKTILGADPKSGLAVLLEFARNITENKVKTHPLELVFTLGEEAGLQGAIHLDYSLLKSKMGLVLDEDGPCTSGVIQAPGYYRIDARLQGKTVHPRDWKEGKNVLPALAKILTKFKLGEIKKGVTYNIGLVSAGTARNSIPGNAELYAELRSFNTLDLKEQGLRVVSSIKEIAKAHNLQVEIDHKIEFCSYAFKQTHPLLKKISQTYTALGLKPNYYKTFGGSDAAIFNEKGIAAIAIGSGYYLAHQYTEYVDLNDMEQLLQFLLHFTKA